MENGPVPGTGTVIADRYRLVEELGRGGMARVYRATDLELDEDIALKLLTQQTEWQDEAADRFKREIRLARRIVHPNVGRIYDFNRWHDLLFVTMELIEGETLADRMDGAFLGGLEERLAVFRDVVAGIRAAHQLGIIHLDIKPSNIMITPEKRSVVMDFGIALEMGRGDAADGEHLAGTPSYCAPERLLGEPADHRSDIYSLGILLFELTTGRKPFTGSVPAVMQAHLNQRPPRVRELNPLVPDAVDRAVSRMLNKEPELRHQSVDEVLAELAEIRLGGVGRTVLLAIGDIHLQALFAHHLAAFDLVVRAASDGEQALESLLRETPDLLLLDLELPRIDGLRIVEIMRRMPHAAAVPVVVLSANRNPAYSAYAKQLQVERFILRPYASRILAGELSELLGVS